MLVIVATYTCSQLDELRKFARELMNGFNNKSMKLEVFCSYDPSSETFRVIARLFLFGKLNRTSTAIDGCERTSFLRSIKGVLN